MKPENEYKLNERFNLSNRMVMNQFNTVIKFRNGLLTEPLTVLYTPSLFLFEKYPIEAPKKFS